MPHPPIVWNESWTDADFLHLLTPVMDTLADDTSLSVVQLEQTMRDIRATLDAARVPAFLQLAYADRLLKGLLGRPIPGVSDTEEHATQIARRLAAVFAEDPMKPSA